MKGQGELGIVGRRLRGHPGAFLLRDGARWVAGALPEERSEAVDPEPELPFDARLPRLPRWVGLLPYDAFREVERTSRRGAPGRDARATPHLEGPLWFRYGAVLVVESGVSRVEGEPRAVRRLVEALGARLSAGGTLEWGPEVDPGDLPAGELGFAEGRPLLAFSAAPEAPELHRARIERALVHVARGDLYQVNLARRFEFRVEADPFSLLFGIGRGGFAAHAAALEFDGLGVVSSSPELFLDLRPNGTLRTRPIKGTRPRGTDAERDRALAAELETSEKERAELTMVIDIERNDLGRVAQVGSVRLSEAPHVTRHPTVLHREAEVEAKLRPGVGRAELLRVMMPSGSVTGAPKVRAMELIAELESARRGLYTGALGMLGHDGGLVLSMAIRVLTIRQGVGHYSSGGGIVADSDPGQEVEETLWKAEQLLRLARSPGDLEPPLSPKTGPR